MDTYIQIHGEREIQSLYTGVYIGYIREFMYLFFYIYLLSLFLSLLYIFIFFGREELKRYIYKDGWKGGRVAGMAEQK